MMKPKTITYYFFFVFFKGTVYTREAVLIVYLEAKQHCKNNMEGWQCWFLYKGMLLKLNNGGAMAAADRRVQRCLDVSTCAFGDFKTEESVFVDLCVVPVDCCASTCLFFVVFLPHLHTFYET